MNTITKRKPLPVLRAFVRARSERRAAVRRIRPTWKGTPKAPRSLHVYPLPRGARAKSNGAT